MSKASTGITHCLIAYFDVLGYKEFLKDPNNNEYLLLSSIKEEFEKLNRLNTDKDLKINGLKVRTFSDNVVLVMDTSTDSDKRQLFNSLSLMVGIIQLLFLDRHDLLIRGSVVYGDAFINESMVFGKGLIDAVEVESEKAIFPRILIDQSIKEQFGDSASSLEIIARDNDELAYINCFELINIYCKNESIGGCLKGIQYKLKERVRKYCRYASNIKDIKKIQARERIISKHLWVIEKFNEYCKKIGVTEYIVDYIPVLNNRLMKFELQLREQFLRKG